MSRVPAVMVVGNWLITNDGRRCWLVQGPRTILPRPLDLGTLSYPLSPPPPRELTLFARTDMRTPCGVEFITHRLGCNGSVIYRGDLL